MPIRLATWADLPTASTVLSRSFQNEDLFGPIMHPYRATYPSDMSLWFLRQLRLDLFNPSCTVLLSHPPNFPLAVTGVAVWGRKGPLGTSLLRREQSWSAWVGEIFVPWYNALEALWRPNRAADPEKSDVLERSFAFVAHYWQSQHRLENWYLQLCGTGPEFQGKGYGRELVGWGTRRAREEGVAASLISAAVMEGFYRKCGFGAPVGWASEGGEENPICDVPGGAIMWIDVEEKS